MTASDITAPVLGGVRVLVADGDEDDSASTAAVLRLNGFNAQEAHTADEALRAAINSHPAVLVTDLDLPDDHGYVLIQRVRQLPDPPKVVVVTAHVEEAVRCAAMKAGASAFLLKPADPVELAKLIGRLCKN